MALRGRRHSPAIATLAGPSYETSDVPRWRNSSLSAYPRGPAIGIRGGAVFHINSTSSGVSPYAWLTRSLTSLSSLSPSAASSWAGSIVQAKKHLAQQLAPLGITLKGYEFRGAASALKKSRYKRL